MKTLRHRLFRKRLKKARKLHDWTQVSLARKTGLKPSAISHFETGTRKPSWENIFVLANALQVSIDWLYGRDIPNYLGYKGIEMLEKDSPNE